MLPFFLVIPLLLLVCFAFAIFFYCQSLCCGLPRKRWAAAGFILGPALLPMFKMKKRMVLNQYYGLNHNRGKLILFFA
jgi:hypothetical protein